MNILRMNTADFHVGKHYCYYSAKYETINNSDTWHIDVRWHLSKVGPAETLANRQKRRLATQETANTNCRTQRTPTCFLSSINLQAAPIPESEDVFVTTVTSNEANQYLEKGNCFPELKMADCVMIIF